MNIDNARSSCCNTQANCFRKWLGALFCAIAALTLASGAYADPPARVARLAYINGAVSFSPAGEDVWVEAAINRPLITGDRLWVDTGSRAELQVGSAVFYLGAGNQREPAQSRQPRSATRGDAGLGHFPRAPVRAARSH
jgi:hypothetical protein